MSNCEDIQMKFYENKDEGAKLLPVSIKDWEVRAKQILAAGPFDYVNGGSRSGRHDAGEFGGISKVSNTTADLPGCQPAGSFDRLAWEKDSRPFHAGADWR
ncbi:hypothetical protein [Siminovitchia sp. 179-K 8D1 HS]|uniref:hypothetical protein n=1 Tax=Siminovitchia sp. 179-K 8D1 HS TaxID=3142385 RepID=UPI0039A2D583